MSLDLTAIQKLKREATRGLHKDAPLFSRGRGRTTRTRNRRTAIAQQAVAAARWLARFLDSQSVAAAA